MCTPAVFLEAAGLSALPTPTGLFLPSQQPLSESPKLPALRADVSAKVRARHLGFLLPRRFVDASSTSLAPPQAAGLVHSAASPLSTEPAALGFGRIFVPHGGATSGFLVFGVYALGCVRKAVQTVDTGATVRNALSVTAASPVWVHSAPAKSPDRAAPAAYVPAAYSRLPFCRAALLSLPHSGGN